jgi:peptidoglycan/LPS O-acetylase OafA/YrhL
MRRVDGLDSIRFILAIIVLIYHIGYSHIYNFIDRTTITGKLVGAGLDCLFNGPAAVIVFFVISGFCIHYPHIKKSEVNILNFYTRRFIRILLPILTCYTIIKIYGVGNNTFTEIVGWSIFCELIYYTIYPLVFFIIKYIKLNFILCLSFILSIFWVWFINPNAFMYPSYGVLGNAIVGLPCFLLGIVLTNFSMTGKFIFVNNIYIIRFFIFLLSSVCFSFMLHLKIGFPWTLNFFAIFAFIWLYHEIKHFSISPPSKFLEWAGKWSYSLYIVHGLVLVLYKGHNIHPYETILEWIFLLLSMLIGSYIFYLIVENPSRILSYKISRFF